MLSDTFYQSLPSMIQEASLLGASYLDDALSSQCSKELSTEASGDAFTTLTPQTGRAVVEDMDIFKITLEGDQEHPLAVELGAELARALNTQISKQWSPNEASFHRYHAGTQALGAHRDFKSDKLFVAVFTIQGTGGFELLHTYKEVDKAWSCKQGGLCLMRAPGLTDAEDDRPLHRALAPTEGTREALIYREVVGDYIGKLV